MPVSSKSIKDYSAQKHGPDRAVLIYAFGDGREISRRVNVASLDEANAKLISMEPEVLASVQGSDSFNAVYAGIKTAHKEASIEQVQYAWLQSGYDEDEHYKAYEKIKDIGPALLSLGLTDAQLAAMFNVRIEDATATREYWEFLDANKIAIEAYSLIAGVKL